MQTNTNYTVNEIGMKYQKMYDTTISSFISNQTINYLNHKHIAFIYIAVIKLFVRLTRHI